MAKRLLGKEVNEALVASLQTRTAALREKGVVPTLGIIRLGENPSDLSYEKGATKRAEEVGVAVKNYILPEETTKEELLAVIDGINADNNAPVEYFNMQGIRVDNPENGLFIRRQGNKAEKVFINNK